MRFMMLMSPKGYESATPGTMPDAAAVAALRPHSYDERPAAGSTIRPGSFVTAISAAA
ncbi:MAG: hypothetical protein ACXWJ7_14110 [Caldimonas sp.]